MDDTARKSCWGVTFRMVAAFSLLLGFGLLFSEGERDEAVALAQPGVELRP